MREPRRSSSRCSKCRYYCRAGTTSLMSHFGLCSLVVGYCVMGAFLFEYLEASNERNKRLEMMRWRSSLADALWQLTAEAPLLDQANWTGEAVARLRRFEVTLVQAVRKEGYDGKEDAQLQWSFTGALLYSIIVITTIGYGNIAPKTPQGKVMTILYAIVGIPLMLLCLSNIGDAMAQSFKFSYRYICCSICHRKAVQRAKGRYARKSFQQEHQSQQYQPQQFQMQPRSLGRNMAGQGTGAARGSSLAAPPSYKELSTCRTGPGGFPPSRPLSSAGRRQADLEAARVPIISNKYALGEDAGGGGSSAAHDYRAAPPARTGRRAWRDEGGELADDESVNALEDDDDEAGDEEDDEVVGSVPIWLCCAIVVGYICGGAWLFYSWEGWGYLDSAYFCFVTLTTIGFGDLVPGTALSDDQTVTLAVCAVYLLFGMALLAMSFNLVQEEVTRSVKCVGRRLGILSDRDEDR